MRNIFKQTRRAQLLSLGLGVLVALIMGGVALMMSDPNKPALWTTITALLNGALLIELGLLGCLVGGLVIVWLSGGFKRRQPRQDK